MARHPGDETLTAMIGIPVLALILAVFVLFESWKYEECLKDRGDEDYCRSQTASCMGAR